MGHVATVGARPLAALFYLQAELLSTPFARRRAGKGASAFLHGITDLRLGV